MVLNLYKYRVPIMVVSLFFAFIPLIFKLGYNDLQSHSRSKSIYGQYINWPEVNNILPRYTVITVTDIDTGLQFCAQIRGGNCHIDVQPLTAEDTAIMKKIYNGRWTWKRRAVTVQADDGIKIAASMNGMPHGQGAIKGNNFNGHFCIHFANSKTHGSKRIDLAHQMMIWKSANIIDKQLVSLTAQETMQIFLTAVNQGDKVITTRIISSQDEACWKVLQGMEYLYIISSKKDGDIYNLNVRVKYVDSPQAINQTMILKMVHGKSGWKIAPKDILALNRVRSMPK